MSNLALLVGSLKREVAVPGTFDTLFPDTADTDLAGTLLDAFWTARIDGWFPLVDVDSSGLTTPDMSRDAQQLVVLYAAYTVIRTQLGNLASRRTYKVGNIEVTTEHAATVLKQQLDGARKRIEDILLYARTGSGTKVTTFDGYALRALAFYDVTQLTGGLAAIGYGISEGYFGSDAVL
jgi:hypothetical protein